MTERTETITEREYDIEGHLIKETVTTIVEKDDGSYNNLNHQLNDLHYYTYTGAR